MPLTDNEQIQEIALITTEKFGSVGKFLWVALGVALIGFIPAYFALKFIFVQTFMQSYTPPEIIYAPAVKEPLEIVEKKIFTLPNGTYSGFVKIKNINNEWGINSLNYTAEFKTYGGTTLSKVNRSTYILPAKEKIIVLPRFQTDKAPDEIVFTWDEPSFIHKPEIDFSYELQRTTLSTSAQGLVVYAGITNTTAFTLRQVDLPALIYNNQNQIIGVNFTYINDLLSGETRTFQYSPVPISGATRSEITPEINIFDPDTFAVSKPVSPIDDVPSAEKPRR